MDVSAEDLVRMTRDYVMAGRTPVLNEVETTFTPGDETLKVKRALRGITPGAVVTVGWTDFYVWDYEQGSRTLAVRAGWNDSPVEMITPGTLLTVQPRWTDWQILRQLNMELRSLSGADALWEKLPVEVLWDGAHEALDLPFERPVYRVLAVQAESARGWEWSDLNPSSYRFVGDAHDEQFPSGQALNLFNYDLMTPGRRLRVLGAAALLPFNQHCGDVAGTTGLPATGVDIPALGVAARLASLEEQRRNQLDAQGDARKTEQVSMTAWTATARDLRRLYERRLSEERANLLALTPYRRGF